MTDLLDNETEIRKLQDEVRRLEQEGVTKLAAADKLRDDMRSSGVKLDSLAEDDVHAFEKVDDAYKEADLCRQNAHALTERMNKMLGWSSRNAPAASGSGTSDPGAKGAALRDSLGKRFIESEAYARNKGTYSNTDVPVRLDGIKLMSREELIAGLRMRAGLDLASGQAMVTPDFSLIPPVELPVRPVMLLDLISMQTTDSDAVVWGQQTQRVLAAAPTPTGVNAPQSTMAFQRVTSNVQRIPVLLTVPKEVLADEGRLEGILNNQLMDDTRLTVEAQVLGGDGSGVNFLGVTETPGIQSYALDDEYDLDAIHKGITAVRLHLFQDPDAIGLHPSNLENIMLQKDNYGRYIFEPSAEQTSIWGFKAVSSPVFTAGTAVVGNWRLGATLWLREDVVVTATDGYTDTASGVNYFSAGLVAILAQIRAAFAVERPFAFCEVTNLT